MKKRLIILLAVSLLSINIAGCGSKVKNDNTPNVKDTTYTTETETTNGTQISDDTEKVEKATTEATTASEEENVSDTEENVSDTQENLSDTQENQQEDPTQNTLLKVLQNKMTFIDTNNASKQSYLKSIYYGDGVTCTPKQFALVDFDRDGEPEICVQVDLGFDSEFVVLHNQDGKVYGYSFPYRALQQLGNNGYYLASSSASNTDIMKMDFDGSKVIKNKVAYSSVDSGNNPVYFKGSGAKMEEKDWTKLLNSVQKNPPVWHTFDEEDWESYLE